MPKDTLGTWAKLVGRGFAHVQDGIDFFVEMGFSVMKKAGNEPKKEPRETNKYIGSVKKLGRGVLRFFGTVGDEFYNKYEELKRERKQ